MQIRQCATWFLALILVVLLTPGVAFGQESDSDPEVTASFLSVLSMIWEQLGLGDQGGNETGTTPLDLGGSISPDGAASEDTEHDMGPSISPTG